MCCSITTTTTAQVFERKKKKAEALIGVDINETDIISNNYANPLSNNVMNKRINS